MSTTTAAPCLPTLEFLTERNEDAGRDELLPLAEAVIDAVDRAFSQPPDCRQIDDDSIRRLTQHVLRTLAAEASAGRLHYASSDRTPAPEEPTTIHAS